MFESYFKFLGQVTVGLMAEYKGGASFEHQIVAAPGIEIKSLVKNQWETFRFLGVWIDLKVHGQSEKIMTLNITQHF